MAQCDAGNLIAIDERQMIVVDHVHQASANVHQRKGHRKRGRFVVILRVERPGIIPDRSKLYVCIQLLDDDKSRVITITPLLFVELQIPPNNGRHVLPFRFANVGFRAVIIQAQDQMARDRVPFKQYEYIVSNWNSLAVS
jgi:hypothetical protein|uniref:Uncharacterized protein n=1 Tax=Sipha flava TaxID=143950 RepID=A0A2S2R3R0_9HEMI